MERKNNGWPGLSAGSSGSVRRRLWGVIYLPPPRRVLDVGGGTGVYTMPLSFQGYEVHLLDAVPLHVERAQALLTMAEAPLASAKVGDARRLELPDETFHVVLLFGPLYHLTDRDDRITALAEARRVLVPGGVLLSAYISRFASACDGIQDGMLRDAAFSAIVERDLTDGIHQNPADRPDSFRRVFPQAGGNPAGDRKGGPSVRQPDRG